MSRPVLYHIPVCPFSQRVEILLSLKGLTDEIDFHVVDITRPRPPWLLQKTRGTTALPVLEIPGGRIIKESLVILQYLEDVYPECPVAQTDPYLRAVENMLTAREGRFGMQGYSWVMNQDPERRNEYRAAMLDAYRQLNDFLSEHSPKGPFLFEQFGWAETVFTPLFIRFWFLDYYEDFQCPDEPEYARVKQWLEACMAHPSAQQVSREEVVKLYYDYALGAGNGSLLPGRSRSSFVFDPHWQDRPWPPANKYEHTATDKELGL